jgi:hypothetical protein
MRSQRMREAVSALIAFASTNAGKICLLPSKVNKLCGWNLKWLDIIEKHVKYAWEI